MHCRLKKRLVASLCSLDSFFFSFFFRVYISVIYYAITADRQNSIIRDQTFLRGISTDSGAFSERLYVSLTIVEVYKVRERPAVCRETRL